MPDLGPVLSALAGAWLPTFVAHSTVLVGLALVVTRFGPFQSWAVRDLVWTAALWGGLVTAALRVALFADRVTAPLADPPAFLLWVPLALLIWLAVGAVLSLRALVRLARAAAALGRRRPVGDPAWRALATEAAHDAGLARPFRLTASDRLRGPLALGHREVCLPARALELPEDERRALLAHEAWHLRRRDPLWGVTSAFAEAVLFVQPLLGVARRQREVAAEHLCDAHAAEQAGARPVAQALVRVGGWVTERSAPGTSAFADASLGARVERLLGAPDTTRPRARRRWQVGLSAALLLLAPLLPAPGAAVLGGGHTLSPQAETRAARDFFAGHDAYHDADDLEAALAAWLRVPRGSRYYGEARRLIGFNIYARSLGRWPEARGYLAQAVLADPVGEGILEDAVRAAVLPLFLGAD